MEDANTACLTKLYKAIYVDENPGQKLTMKRLVEKIEEKVDYSKNFPFQRHRSKMLVWAGTEQSTPTYMPAANRAARRFAERMNGIPLLIFWSSSFDIGRSHNRVQASKLLFWSPTQNLVGMTTCRSSHIDFGL